MQTHVNHNYRIGVDTLPNGKVRAQARGRVASRKTFPEGTSHLDAASQLARKVEGERFAHVAQVSGHSLKSDWSVYVN